MKQLLCSLLLLAGTLGCGMSALAQPKSTSESFYQRHQAALMQQFGRLASEADLRFLLKHIIDRNHLEADPNQYFQPNPAPLSQLASQRNRSMNLSQIRYGLIYPLLRFVLPKTEPYPRMDVASPVGERVAAQAYQYLGVRYGPSSFNRQTGQGALDCSGLVRYVFEDLSITLRNGNAVAGLVDSPDLRRTDGEPRPGDLLVRKHKNNRWSHVGIYVGNRQLIEAPYSGTVVRVTAYQPAKWHALLRYVGH